MTVRKNQVTAYTYDSLNRLQTVTYDDASTTTHTYDAGDRLTQIVDSVAGTITRGYDGLDRVTSETTPEGVVSYTYDAADRGATMTVASQPQVIYGYDRRPANKHYAERIGSRNGVRRCGPTRDADGAKRCDGHVGVR